MCNRTCTVDRRCFLGGCMAGAAGLAGLPTPKAQAGPSAAGDRPRIQLVFIHPDNDRPIWPNIGYDFEMPKEHIALCLKYACPRVEFRPITVKGAEDTRALIAKNKTEPVDGYLAYVLGITWQRPSRILAETGLPLLMVDHLFAGSGGFLTDFAANRRQGCKVEYVSSSNFEDVIAAARCFEVLEHPGKTADDFLAACAETRKKRTRPLGELSTKPDQLGPVEFERGFEQLEKSRLLVVSNYPQQRPESADPVFGIKIRPIDFAELRDAYTSADQEQAAVCADRWAKGAERVFEPTPDELRRSGAAYLAMLALLKKHDAQAIAVNCLGGFYGGHLTAYPCLGFCQMNSDGLVGACEADVRSALTMQVMRTLIGRPGFISDPVIDTAQNRIIYAHCVAPYKMFGPAGPENPYQIMSHSEDRKGASVRSLLPLGYLTSTMEIDTRSRQLIFHQGVSVENVNLDRACRTKLAVEVDGDIDQLMNYWDRWGWHRVTFYGDLRPVVEELCRRRDLTLVEEA
jgi:hypothetical protein